MSIQHVNPMNSSPLKFIPREKWCSYTGYTPFQTFSESSYGMWEQPNGCFEVGKNGNGIPQQSFSLKQPFWEQLESSYTLFRHICNQMVSHLWVWAPSITAASSRGGDRATFRNGIGKRLTQSWHLIDLRISHLIVGIPFNCWWLLNISCCFMIWILPPVRYL